MDVLQRLIPTGTQAMKRYAGGDRIQAVEREMLTRGKKYILGCGSFLSVHELAKRFDVQAELLAPALAEWVADHRIFEIEHDGCSLFPSYAFSGDAGISPQSGLREVIAILSQMKDGWAMSFWFISPNGLLGGRRPQGLLSIDPQAVALAARDEVKGFTQG
ncbi:hypothetical protein [Pseudomonas sp. ACM7]|uniref:hypothetical protein n=1 Tax=Pseudomonas sp. ACM7 TaxID=2052956 RepID=UPI001012EB7F|nr:hypothetical protein [Pseudomonas sp. ACM7]QAY90707.1 hypothetical protein CUN63_12530 [Pseudomonas sp. ACM7]